MIFEKSQISYDEFLCIFFIIKHVSTRWNDWMHAGMNCNEATLDTMNFW